MNKTALFIVASVATVATSLATFSVTGSEKTNLKEVKDDRYKPGQVWTYKTRPGEETSTFTVLRVEAAPEGKRIVHIHVDHIRLKNCTGGPEPDTLQHMPFFKNALDDSALRVTRTGEVPDYTDGYYEWRKGWDAGKAGAYTVTVGQALDVAEETFRHGLGCPKGQ
jgi:hypothetical protein